MDNSLHSQPSVTLQQRTAAQVTKYTLYYGFLFAAALIFGMMGLMFFNLTIAPYFTPPELLLPDREDVSLFNFSQGVASLIALVPFIMVMRHFKNQKHKPFTTLWVYVAAVQMFISAAMIIETFLSPHAGELTKILSAAYILAPLAVAATGYIIHLIECLRHVEFKTTPRFFRDMNVVLAIVGVVFLGVVVLLSMQQSKNPASSDDTYFYEDF